MPYHLFLASKDLANGPALMVFQGQDLAFRRGSRVVLAPVPSVEEGCVENTFLKKEYWG